MGLLGYVFFDDHGYFNPCSLFLFCLFWVSSWCENKTNVFRSAEPLLTDWNFVTAGSSGCAFLAGSL